MGLARARGPKCDKINEPLSHTKTRRTEASVEPEQLLILPDTQVLCSGYGAAYIERHDILTYVSKALLAAFSSDSPNPCAFIADLLLVATVRTPFHFPRGGKEVMSKRTRLQIAGFKETGEVPLPLQVASEAALRTSIALRMLEIQQCEEQLESAPRMSRHGNLDRVNSTYGMKMLATSDAMLRKKLETTRAELVDLNRRWLKARDKTIGRYVPKLQDMHDMYSARFDAILEGEGELEELEEVPALCKACNQASTIVTPDMQVVQVVQQDLPRDDYKPTSVVTLLELLDHACQIHHLTRLIAEAAVTVTNGIGSKVVMPPIKTLERTFQKVQADYCGDFTRIVDLVRCTIVFDSVSTLVAALRWLLQGAAVYTPSFKALRAKDRLSLKWDAGMSGGNRDILLNGAMTTESGKRHIVEIQLHLRELYEIKEASHTLYEDARQLQLFDSLTLMHQGQLSAAVLKRAHRGVVRKIRSLHSEMTPKMCAEVQSLLQTRRCPLFELDLTGSTDITDDGCSVQPAFAGWTLQQLLDPGGGDLHCEHIRILKIGRLGLCGEIPDCLQQCKSLASLWLERNDLVGQIPGWIGNLKGLRSLSLSQNRLTGSIPRDLAECKWLETLTLDDNQLSGWVPCDAFVNFRALWMFKLHGNPSLQISKDGKAMLSAQYRQHLDNITWPRCVSSL